MQKLIIAVFKELVKDIIKLQKIKVRIEFISISTFIFAYKAVIVQRIFTSMKMTYEIILKGGTNPGKHRILHVTVNAENTLKTRKPVTRMGCKHF